MGQNVYYQQNDRQMPVRMGGKGKLCALLVGMGPSTAYVKNSMKFPPKM